MVSYFLSSPMEKYVQRNHANPICTKPAESNLSYHSNSFYSLCILMYSHKFGSHRQHSKTQLTIDVWKTVLFEKSACFWIKTKMAAPQATKQSCYFSITITHCHCTLWPDIFRDTDPGTRTKHNTQTSESSFYLPKWIWGYWNSGNKTFSDKKMFI